MIAWLMVVLPIDNNETENELRRFDDVGEWLFVRLASGGSDGASMYSLCLRSTPHLDVWALLDGLVSAANLPEGRATMNRLATGCLA